MFWSATINNGQLRTALCSHVKLCHLAGHPHLLKASGGANSCTQNGPTPERMPRQNPRKQALGWAPCKPFHTRLGQAFYRHKGRNRLGKLLSKKAVGTGTLSHRVKQDLQDFLA